MNTLTGGDGQLKESSPLFNYEQFPGSPFMEIEKDNKHFLTLGNQALTPEFNSKEELYKYVQTDQTNILAAMCIFITREEIRLSHIRQAPAGHEQPE